MLCIFEEEKKNMHKQLLKGVFLEQWESAVFDDDRWLWFDWLQMHQSMIWSSEIQNMIFFFFYENGIIKKKNGS